MSISERPVAAAEAAPAYLRSPEDVVLDLNTDVTSGLSGQEAAARLATHGPNQITAEKPPQRSRSRSRSYATR
jgi:P-type Ca2+ transporter type 2C